VGAVADDEPFGHAAAATPLEVVDFAEQYGQIEDHSLANHAARPFAQNAAGKQPHDDLLVTDDQGVTRVRTPTQRTTMSANSV